MEEKQIYKCTKCQNNSVFGTEYNDFIEYRCQSCGFNYKVPRQVKKPKINFLKLLEKNAWVLSVITLILLISMFPIFNGQVDGVNSRINTVGSNLMGEIDDNSENLSTTYTDVSNLKYSVGSIEVLISAIESHVTNLVGLDNVVNKIKVNLSVLDENISNIKESISQLFTLIGNDALESRGNLTFTFYKNQTNVTNYCHLDFFVENTETEIGDVKFCFQYDKTNVTLMNWSGIIKPQEYQWLNGSYNDNYFLHWFERGESFSARFNITWNFSDYNTTKIDKGNVTKNLMVNSFLIDDIEVWEKD